MLIASGAPVRCVRTGTRLNLDRLDIDHCLPWSAWPCGDLWNLLPATREVNQHGKRDRLPSAAALAAAHDEIIDWWAAAWEADPALSRRFHHEVAAALPIGADARAEDIFAGLEWRRLRLRQDQQIEEWRGAMGRSLPLSGNDPGQSPATARIVIRRTFTIDQLAIDVIART
jgi:HNH endonuclease